MTHTVRTLLKLGAVSAALMLAACGSPDRQSPSLDLPLTAPSGASGIVADFIEVCSLSMIDQPAAIRALSERGWQAPSPENMQQMAALGGGFASEGENGEQMQIFSIDYPHVEGVSCQLTSTFVEATPDFSPVAQIPGLLGDFTTYGDGREQGQLGRFSGIGPDGRPVILQVLSTGDIFFNLSMTTTRPVTPSDPNQE